MLPLHADSDLEANPTSPVHLLEEEGKLSEQATSIPELASDQRTSEEQSYRETVRGLRSFKGWHQVPEFLSSASWQDDNPFAGPRSQSTGKVSVKLISSYLPKEPAKLNCAFSRIARPSLSTKSPVPDSLAWAVDADSAIQSDSAEESVKHQSPCLVPRASVTEEQVFSEAVEAQIEIQDRKLQPSTIDDYRWEIRPLISARTKISLVSCIVSIEADLKV